ncbi:hypothetical protein N9632_00200 [bacterium]|nr:hypothetical protein [bacterium]
MTNALDTYNKCIAALHLTCQIANEYDMRLWHIVEEEVPASHADLDSRDYACELDSAVSKIPFDSKIILRPHSVMQKIDEEVYLVKLQSRFRFADNVHDYFTLNGRSDLFDGALDELTATYTAPAVVLGALDHALYVSNKAELKDFVLAGFYESHIRELAEARFAEFAALLPWLEHFWTRLSALKAEPEFNHLVKQLQVIVPKIDQVHLYDFGQYELLLKMAGDFSPLVNHLQLAKQQVAVSTP